MRPQIRLAITKAAVVLAPSYAVAFLTDKMVYVVPTLAAASFFAASLENTQHQTTRRVDDDSADADNALTEMTDLTDSV